MGQKMDAEAKSGTFAKLSRHPLLTLNRKGEALYV